MDKFIGAFAVIMLLFSSTSFAWYYHDNGRIPATRQDIGIWLKSKF